ncbi:MAG TPA: hypothetical protein PK357_01850 [Candidatus Pacearchaeota archaeon]|nr:hypothetical protein [Candidatus Pacearchaeota archaeon]
MTNDQISFENEVIRGKYAREITKLLEENSLNWYASPSIKKPEIFIRPKLIPDWDNTSSIFSRISLQVEEGEISLGISGYFPHRITENIKKEYFSEYKYHDKGFTDDGRPKGRFWFTRNVDNLYHFIEEFKKKEPILKEKI